MFDNEIDWVTRLEMLSVRREARQQRSIPSTFEYKAEHKQLSSSESSISGKCSSKKSVFRRSGDCARERARPVSEAENRLTLEPGPKRFGSLHGVNSMVKLLRAHGGCLGRDRR
jgi:hypothetical protein